MPQRTTGLAATAVVLLLALTGCGETSPAPESMPVTAKSATDETPAAAEPEEPAIGYGPTGAGEVCDPQNLNDSICAAFYPDQLVINVMSSPRAREPLASMSDEEKLAIARQACVDMEAGARPHVIETHALEGDPEASLDRNNLLVYTAGSLAYCNDYAEGKSAAYISYYKTLGEDGAKADFADKTMPSL